MYNNNNFCSSIKTENGSVELSNHGDNVESFARDPIPGAAYSKLKNELMNKIAQKRNEEFLKKNSTILEATSFEEAEHTDCESDDEDGTTLDKIIDVQTNYVSAEVRYIYNFFLDQIDFIYS